MNVARNKIYCVSFRSHNCLRPINRSIENAPSLFCVYTICIENVMLPFCLRFLYVRFVCLCVFGYCWFWCRCSENQSIILSITRVNLGYLGIPFTYLCLLCFVVSSLLISHHIYTSLPRLPLLLYRSASLVLPLISRLNSSTLITIYKMSLSLVLMPHWYTMQSNTKQHS